MARNALEVLRAISMARHDSTLADSRDGVF
jgi:hypothetical protein